jgi:hypothetical protein
MSVSTTVSSVTYTGNASTSAAYTVPFQFFDSTDLLVVVSTAGVPTTLVNGTGYTVTGGSGSTGSIVTTSAVPATSQVIITRNTAKTQLTSYTTGDRFPALTHERALDKLTMLVQEATVSSLPPTATASGSAPYVLQASSASATPAWVPQSAGGIAASSITNTMLAGGITPDKLSTGAPTWNAGGTLTATSFVGNASTATSAARLTTPRTISISGDVTGTASFDGSANATIASTIANLPNGIVTAAKLGSNEQQQLCRAWGNVTSAGALTGNNFGVTSVTKVAGNGNYTVVLNASYSQYVVVANATNGSGFQCSFLATNSTTFSLRTFGGGGSATDSAFCFAVFGL